MNGEPNVPDSIDPGGSSDYDDVMNARVTRLEMLYDRTMELLYGLAAEVAVIKSNYATKSDITQLSAYLEGRINKTETELSNRFHESMNEQTWRLVTFVCGFGTALVTVTYFIAKNSY